MAPLNLAILALFSNLFALVRHLKSTFLLLFGKIGGEGVLKPEGGGGMANRPKI